ncbi:MAG: recombinase family protein [Beijerinckiaceae bacterium]|jgi:site-specific DNA recombinase|nr:recombinase family protein [Beijerinckiaceae bacterium]
MRAVIYARYSSDLQREASIEDQVRVCRELAQTRGWREIRVYSDRASSGSNKFRPAYQELLADARSGAFDVIIAEALDRLSRDQEDVAALFKALRFADVALHTLSEGEITELHVGLKGTMNALFLKDLAAKTHRGLRGRIEQKRSAGGRCFGYRVTREFDAAGDKVCGGREIDVAEAAVVRRIFEEFSTGASPRAIAKRLNGEQVAGPNGAPWQDTTIRGHGARGTGILRNELYVGRLVWNRQRFIRDPQTGKRVARMNPASEWLIEEVPDLRIIDEALWTKTKARLVDIAASPTAAALRESGFWTKRRPKHLLTGLVHCGSCGHPMAAVGKDYLRCARAYRNGLCDSRASIRRGLLEDIVVKALQHNLMAPELVQEFVAAANAEINRSRAEETAERDQLGGKLASVERQLDSIVEAIANGLRSGSLQAKLDQLESERAELVAKMAAPAPSPVRLHPNLAEAYREKVAALRDALQDDATRAEAFEIVRSLIEKILVHDRAGDKPEIELIGEIARMVEISIPGFEMQKAAPGGAAFDDRTVSSVKLVAGTGFEPVTFRL